MKYIYLFIILLFLFSCHSEQTIPVEIDVKLHIKDDNYTSPLHVAFENRSRSASNFLWTFEGGEPATSKEKNPGTIIFRTPGEHKVTLEAWNDGDRQTKTFTVRVDNSVTTGFKTEVETNNYAPARFNITNLSEGGTSYNWSFEGGEPSTYEEQHPPTILYKSAGTYTILLTVGNGSATFIAKQEVVVEKSLDASFSISPSFEDIDDYEAPLRATFDTQLQGVESLKWQCAGANITNPTSTEASIYFPSAGTYTVNLNVSNGKDTKTISQQIVVNPNTNLRTHKDIKFGINTAQNTIAPYYSTKLRQSFTSSLLTAENGASIDVVFWGLNTGFSYNKFVSPNALSSLPLAEVPGATYTKFINKQEIGTVLLTPAQFDSMTNDNLLKAIPVSTISYGDENFAATPLPRVILFETADGRKGAILVKEMISNGTTDSYIIADIKIQKND